MDWRLLPENRAIAERFDAVSASFPFYSNFLDVFKKVEEKIQARNEKRLRNKREDEDEECNSDADEKAEESTSERQYSKESGDERDAADKTEKCETAVNHDNNHSSLTSGDCEDAIKPVNSLIIGQSAETTESELSSDAWKIKNVEPQGEEQFKSALQSDDQPQLKHLPTGSPGNVDGQNLATSEEWDGDNVFLSERNTMSLSHTEFGINDIVSISSFSRSECDAIESAPAITSHPGKNTSSDGVSTRNSSESEGLTEEGHDICEEDDVEDGKSDTGFEGLESRMDAEEIDDDNDDEDITDSDDESSVSEKLLWLHLSNFRTMVNLVPGKNFDRARRLNTKVLRRHPTNFIALRNKVNLYMKLSLSSDHSTFISSALETLERLEVVANDRKEMLLSKAEVAAIHDRISSSANDLLDYSVPLYEEVLQEINDHLPPVVAPSDSIFRDLAALWKRDLASVYLTLMRADKTVLA